MRIHDISQAVDTRIAVWPGDRAFRLDWTMRIDAGDSVNVAAVTMSAHTGTHVDGPGHVVDGEIGAAQVPLDRLIGSARVVDARGRQRLDESVLDASSLNDGTERLLFRTRDRTDPTRFPRDYAAFTPELAGRLAAAGVKLVGTDAPSLDPMDSKTLDAHRALIAGGVAIVENLVLDGIEAGEYTLIVLPLRLLGADSAPARAVLVEGF